MRDTFEHKGMTFALTTEHDPDSGPPWDNEDGHGTVSEWTRRDKRAGELVLDETRMGGEHLFYDFAEACRIARRDGWGFLPGKLETSQTAPGVWRAYVRGYGNGKLLNFEGAGNDVNAAIAALYAAHKASYPSPRAYAAAAAMADFERLKAWCDDEWTYVGVVVTLCDDDGQPMREHHASLWGIESDATDYIENEVGPELADEIIAELEAMGKGAAA